MLPWYVLTVIAVALCWALLALADVIGARIGAWLGFDAAAALTAYDRTVRAADCAERARDYQHAAVLHYDAAHRARVVARRAAWAGPWLARAVGHEATADRLVQLDAAERAGVTRG